MKVKEPTSAGHGRARKPVEVRDENPIIARYPLTGIAQKRPPHPAPSRGGGNTEGIRFVLLPPARKTFRTTQQGGFTYISCHAATTLESQCAAEDIWR